MLFEWTNIGFLVLLLGLSPVIIVVLYQAHNANTAFNQTMYRLAEEAPSSVDQLALKMNNHGLSLDFDTAYAWVTFCAFKKDLLLLKDATSDMIVNCLMWGFLSDNKKQEDMTDHDFTYLLFCMLKIWSNSGLPITCEAVQEYVHRWTTQTSHLNLNHEILCNWLHNEIDFGSDSNEYKTRLAVGLNHLESTLSH